MVTRAHRARPDARRLGAGQAPPSTRAPPVRAFATPEQIEARYYAPLQQLPIDYWMPYVDADDVVAWSAVVVDALDDGMRRVIAEGRAAGLLVPDLWPPTP